MQTAKVVRNDPGLDAIFWDGSIEDVKTIAEWTDNRHGNTVFLEGSVHHPAGKDQLKITTDGGQVYLQPFRWLIEYAPGEFEVCSPKQFYKRYRVVGGL